MPLSNEERRKRRRKPPFLQIRLGITTNIKFKRLRRRLGPEACWAVVTLWDYVGTHAPEDGTIAVGRNEIEEIAEWDGEEGALVKQLLDLHLIEPVNGHFEIHDWEEHQEFLARTRPLLQAASKRGVEKRWGATQGGPQGGPQGSTPGNANEGRKKGASSLRSDAPDDDDARAREDADADADAAPKSPSPSKAFEVAQAAWQEALERRERVLAWYEDGGMPDEFDYDAHRIRPWARHKTLSKEAKTAIRRVLREHYAGRSLEEFETDLRSVLRWMLDADRNDFFFVMPKQKKGNFDHFTVKMYPTVFSYTKWEDKVARADAHAVERDRKKVAK